MYWFAVVATHDLDLIAAGTQRPHARNVDDQPPRRRFDTLTAQRFDIGHARQRVMFETETFSGLQQLTTKLTGIRGSILRRLIERVQHNSFNVFGNSRDD